MMDLETLRTKMREIPSGKCLIGFSGGADSTAVLLLLARERESGRIEPEAVHVNHGLRGAESDEDEAFCRELCEKLAIPLHTVRAELDGKNDENSCRRERFRCFREIMEKTGIQTLVLAHNRDDLAETFLMRLLRGAGTEGLSCMSCLDTWGNYQICRPLLGARRGEIREALRREGVVWREDSTNGSDLYLRNRIRHQLIPLMEELAAGISGRIAQTAEIISGENNLLQAQAEQFLSTHSDPLQIDAEALKTVPDALLNRILRTWWRKSAPEMKERALNAAQTAELASLARKERGKANLPGGIIAVKGRHGIYLTGFPKETKQVIPFHPGENGRICYGNLTLEVCASEGNPGNGTTEQEVPEGFLQGCVLRTRREGDRIRPFGMKGTRKLQDYMTDRGVDEPVRDRIPLLCRGNEVLLAAGVGAGAVPRWDAEEKNIRLKWIGSMPWKR